VRCGTAPDRACNEGAEAKSYVRVWIRLWVVHVSSVDTLTCEVPVAHMPSHDQCSTDCGLEVDALACGFFQQVFFFHSTETSHKWKNI